MYTGTMDDIQVMNLQNTVLRVKIVKERWYHRLYDLYFPKRTGITTGRITLDLAVDDYGFFVREDIDGGIRCTSIID